jgi:hypothetical protein
MIRGFPPATLPDRFLKAVGDAQYKVLRHHHAEDPSQWAISARGCFIGKDEARTDGVSVLHT